MSVPAFATAPNTRRPPPAVARSLDISDTDLQVPIAFFATADESRIQANGDRSCHGGRLARGRSAKLRADLQGMTAQCLRAPPGGDGQQVLQHASGDAMGHQGGKVSL
jgi:hypothetical protein